MVDQLNYESFIALIENMVDRKESGSLYVRTDTNRSVFVGLNGGKIEALVAGPKRGMEALKTIMQMAHCSCRRDNSTLPYHTRDLPGTNDILLLLKQRNPPQAAGETAPPPPGNKEIDAKEVMAILCHLLHDYLGPAAPVICEDVTDNGATIRTGADLAVAIEQLAKEVDSSVEAGEFIQRARRELREYLA